MTTVQLRSRVLTKLEKTDNMDLLEAVQRTIDLFNSDESEVYILNETELRHVNRGLEQMRNGEVISNAESNRRTREWLKESYSKIQ